LNSRPQKRSGAVPLVVIESEVRSPLECFRKNEQLFAKKREDKPGETMSLRFVKGNVMKATSRRKNSRPASVTPRTQLVHFEYVDPHAESVCLAGTFNDWHPNATPMIASSPGLWMKDLSLAPGAYEYCLIVNGHWKPDPQCEVSVENPFGGLNSVLKVPPPGQQG
jgi:Glycogen recognition site of AMP-activated protein kinase